MTFCYTDAFICEVFAIALLGIWELRLLFFSRGQLFPIKILHLLYEP